MTPGQVIAASYPVTHTAIGTYDNTASVTVTDNDGTTATASDTESVAVTDAMPSVTVTKTANVTTVPETGGEVTYTVTITNTSAEYVTLVSATDSMVNNLDKKISPALPAGLAAGATYTGTY